MPKVTTLLLVVLLFLTACEGVQYSEDANYSYVTITLPEQQVADLLSGLLTYGNPPLMYTAQVQLNAGEIYITGEANDGRGGRLPGTLRAQVWIENGGLRVTVTEFIISGYSADASAIAQVNQALYQGFTQASANDRNATEFTEFNVTDSAVRFTLRAPRTPAP
ncbi:MAG: hypothetical protein SF029_07925 [bacterium]|nr:hypothetical protein [bacterium]